ncbi:MAG: DevR family CRISPR-associated autoregulator [Candidatus Hydrogenedentes bacterium]|nr:DevR family CRISPR-associated autoregulator [Candidatus Hydrogenedentota bacterium]
MSIHVFGAIVTAPGVAANNRGANEGNITTLQKLLWKGQVHTTVSAEAIRWAVRYHWQRAGMPVNRRWNDDKEDHDWQNLAFDPVVYLDDDLLGYMDAKAPKEDGSDEAAGEKTGKKGKAKGTTTKRRGVLEVTRSISTTPFVGDMTFNAKSGEKGRTSLYGTEVHATRYQYGFALTPERLTVPERAAAAIDAVVSLGEVAGNHSRFLFDFSPESIILRVTEDPAPRLLYCFEEREDGKIGAPLLMDRIKSGDIAPEEIFIGGNILEWPYMSMLPGVNLFHGVKAAAEACKAALAARLKG